MLKADGVVADSSTQYPTTSYNNCIVVGIENIELKLTQFATRKLILEAVGQRRGAEGALDNLSRYDLTGVTIELSSQMNQYNITGTKIATISAMSDDFDVKMEALGYEN